MKDIYMKPSVAFEELDERDVLTESPVNSGTSTPDLGDGDQYEFPNF